MTNVLQLKPSYQKHLDSLTNFELLEEMSSFMNIDGPMNESILRNGIVLWDTIQKRCITDELALLASTLKQQYKYELKDVKKT